MKAKKLQALLLAAVMVVSLAACGDTATTEKADDKTETKTNPGNCFENYGKLPSTKRKIVFFYY